MQINNLAYIPSPPQGVWFIAGMPLIRAYGICIVLGIAVALWLSTRRYVARGGKTDTINNVAIVVIISGIIGARLYHVATDHEKYFCTTCNPTDAFKITNGGLSIIGAAMAAMFCAWIYLRRKNISYGLLADSIAPTILIAQGIGRFGNYFNQEIYGRPTTLPWGLEIFLRRDASGTVDMMYGHSTGQIMTIVHPTFLYESLWCFAAAAVLLWLDHRKRFAGGTLLALYVVVYSFGRFWIELMRADEATHILGLRVNTITSTATFIIGLVLFFVLNNKKYWRSLTRFFTRSKN
ncbi:MAG: prolipoprotein diacylglyceryl transferase [Corynebacterium sp.]|nr:prolipoprotein diacylglyceryl transferase [Corynebacterium sp.]